MPLDLGHVGHAPNAEAEVLAIQGAGDGAGNAGLAHARGAVEAEDLALGGASELADSNELLRAEVGSRETRSLAALCRARAVPGISLTTFSHLPGVWRLQEGTNPVPEVPS